MVQRGHLAGLIFAASALIAAPAAAASDTGGAGTAPDAGAAAAGADAGPGGDAADATAAGGAAAPGAGTATGATDSRQRIVLPAPARNQVLKEMRIMLASLQGIFQALANDALEAVAREARASGMASAVDVDPQVRDKLPDAFLSLGVATHQGFDELAARAEQGATEEDVLRSLAGLTSNCVACHEAYRIDEAR